MTDSQQDQPEFDAQSNPVPALPVRSEDIAGELQDGPGSQLAGQVLGKYRIGDRLGSGAMSTVYRATELATGQPVALKILPPGADPVSRSRFRQEAQTAAQLDHPHIVRTLAVGEVADSGLAYIAMELVEGESLGDLLERQRQLDVQDACLVLEPIARALDFAHRAGIVHRDVKPSNILLRRTTPGTSASVTLAVCDDPVVPLLTDFGIARALDAPELTSAGRTIGTPAYMAPEQCSGAHDIDGRADIYALGAVLYRCVVGRPPFTGTTTQILYAHVYSPLLVPDDVMVTLPLPVVDMLRNALMKEPSRRFRSATAFADELGHITRAGPATAPHAFGHPDDVTATMASLPAMPRQAPTATTLAPAPPDTSASPRSARRNRPQPTALEPTARGSLRRFAAPATTVIALLVLVALGTWYLPRLFGAPPIAVAPPTQGTVRDPAVAPIDGTEPGSTPPNGSQPGDNSTSAGEATVPPSVDEIPLPTFDVPSVWNDAGFFYGERDWAQTLETMTLLLRSDIEFNRRLLSDEGTLAQLYVELLQSKPDSAFWQEWANLFTPAEVDDILYDTFVGLAARENSRNRPVAATEYWNDALLIRPGDATIAALADASDKLAAALPADRVNTRETLQQLHIDYAARLAESELYCEAAQQQVAAVGLQSTPELVDRLVEYEELCAEALDLSAGLLVDDRLAGRIVYSTNDGDHYRIYAADAREGAVPRLVVEDGAQPSVDPTRTRLAYFSTRRDQVGLWLYPLNTGLTPDDRGRRLTGFFEDGRDAPARWSPLGDRVVFSSTRENDRRDRVYVTWADGQDNTAFVVLGKDPVWHPREDLILYNGADQAGNRPGLWLVRSDGTNTRPLTNGITDLRPVWSPDTQFVVFMSRERDGNWELYRLDLDTGELLRLTNDPAQDGLPAISPDGKYVAFASDRDGAWAIWVVSSDGGAPKRLYTPVGSLGNWLEHSIDWIE